jgi:DNA polymerase III epsilon subunit-like protein
MTVYTVLLVDTANADRAAICGLAAAVVDDGRVVHRFQRTVRCDGHFDRFNVLQHGITMERFQRAPPLRDVLPDLAATLQDTLVVTSDPFVQVGLSRAAQAAGFELPPLSWIDSRKIVRTAWRQTSGSWRGSLRSIAARLEFRMRWHDPLDRAMTLAAVVETALQAGGLRETHLSVGFENREEVVVFTGRIPVSGDSLRALAVRAGLKITDSVTTDTTILCVRGGDGSAAAARKTPEHLRAEALIADGGEIAIIGEADLLFHLRAEPAVLAATREVASSAQDDWDRSASLTLTS